MNDVELLRRLTRLDSIEASAKELWERSREQGISVEDHLKRFPYAQAAEKYGTYQLKYIWKQHKPENDLPQEMRIAEAPRAEESGLGSWLMMNRHQRYLPCAVHSHAFIEINYQLKGTSLNMVEDQKIQMKAGDIVILSPGCRHQIQWCEQDDLVMNLLLFPHCAERIIQTTSWGDNQLTAFFVDALYRGAEYNNYIFFPADDDPLPTVVLNRIVREYYSEKKQEYLVEELCRSFFAILANRITEHPGTVRMRAPTHAVAARLVQYLMNHCVDATRQTVAEAFGYNESYISTLIRKSTGKTFVQLRNEFRLERIEEELNTTTKSVREIAEKYGFENATHFYREYQKRFGHLPRK